MTAAVVAVGDVVCLCVAYDFIIAVVAVVVVVVVVGVTEVDECDCVRLCCKRVCL